MVIASRPAAIVALVSILVAGVSNSPAWADEYDFVSWFERDGIHYQSIVDLVNLGNLACGELRAGFDVTQVARDVRSFMVGMPSPYVDEGMQTPSPGLLTAKTLNGSTTVLCPD